MLALLGERYPTASALVVGLAAAWSGAAVLPIANESVRAGVACACGVASYVGWRISTAPDVEDFPSESFAMDDDVKGYEYRRPQSANAKSAADNDNAKSAADNDSAESIAPDIAY